MVQVNLFVKQKYRYRLREWTFGPRGRGIVMNGRLGLTVCIAMCKIDS